MSSRRKTLVLLVMIAISACSSSEQPGGRSVDSGLPRLEVGIGWTPEQVARQSSKAVEWTSVMRQDGSRGAGGATVFGLHELVVVDEHASFTNSNAGFSRAFPTAIRTFRNHVRSVSAPATSGLVTLDKAMEISSRLLDEFRARGFEVAFSDHFNNVKLFRLTNWNVLGDNPSPRFMGSFQELRDGFLTTEFFIRSAQVFVLEKDDLAIVLDLHNMRRVSPPPPYQSMGENDLIEWESQTMTKDHLLTEKVYYLEFMVMAKDEKALLLEEVERAPQDN